MKKTIVLGVGNPILKDDGVGIHVAEELKKHIDRSDVKIDTAFTGGMNLLDLMINHDRAILIDAVKRKNKKPGEVELLPFEELSAFHTGNPHDLSLPEALKMSKRLGEKRIPKDIKLIGINLGELPSEFGENLSSEIMESVPRAVELAKKEVERKYD